MEGLRVIRKIALAVGAVLFVTGLLGFIRVLNPINDLDMPYLFELFLTGTALNAFHLIAGIAALPAYASRRYASRYLQAVGNIFAFLTVIGFIQQTTVMGIFSGQYRRQYLTYGHCRCSCIRRLLCR